MNRHPSKGDRHFRFVPPRPSRFWIWVMSFYRRRLILRTHNVSEYAYEELDRLRNLLGTEARLLIAPNHPDNADGLTLFELADELGTMFCYMATHELFEGSYGLRYMVFPRCGIFPIERDGAALSALKAAKDVLVRMKYPLVVYPEGEIYHTNDRLTPLREGTAAMALTAQKALKDEAPVYIVPVALKYRYRDPQEAIEGLIRQLDRLEQRLTWSNHREESMPRRVYRFASGVLALKEVEFLGSTRSGTVPQRVAYLRDRLLARVEKRRLGEIGSDDLPDRVSAVNRHLLDLLKDEELADSERAACRRDLNILFTVVQLFSYPGDYIHEWPTVERIAETLIKFEQDLAGGGYVTPVSDRRLTFRIGEPIDMRDYLGEKSRTAAAMCTEELSKRLQGALDELGTGTHIKDLKS